MQKHQLFCLPFAGGSKYSLRFLEPLLPAHIQCHFLDYPGHGARVGEPFAASLETMVDDLYRSIVPVLRAPFSLYGHSMGATTTALLARRIRNGGGPQPRAVIVSGTDGPSVPQRTETRHLLPRDEFLQSVKKLGGLPDEILQDRELLEYFEPVLRADFRLIEQYEYKTEPPLPLPFTVIVGDEEDIPAEDLAQWQRETSLPVRFHTLPGNHFFIFQEGQRLASIITDAIEAGT